MVDKPDYIVEIGSNGSKSADEPGKAGSAEAKRPFISIMFDCCGVYQRVYKNKAGTAYEGRCPRCMRPVSIKIGPGGSNNRIFRAT